MIRGLIGVIPHHAMEVGRFYLAPGYDDGIWLFQCIQTSEPLNDGFRRKALFFTTGGNTDLGLHELPNQGPVVALDDVHMRIDPASLSGSASTARLKRGLFLLNGDDPIICAPLRDPWTWATVNMKTGQTVEENPSHNWLSFTRWSLVTDDETGSELTIASFDSDKDS